MTDDEDSLRRQLRAQANESAFTFLLENLDADTSGIPEPPEINYDEVEVEPVKLDLLGFGTTGSGTTPSGAYGPPPPPAPTGACCDPDTYACTIESQGQCESHGGTYQGDDTTCSPNPCGCGSRTISLTLIGIWCKQCEDPTHTYSSVFHFAYPGAITMTLDDCLASQSFSGTTSVGGDSSSLDWYVNVTSNGDGTVDIVWGGTITSTGSCGTSQTVSFEFTETGFDCCNGDSYNHNVNPDDNQCIGCHDCSTGEEGYCGSALCGTPYGCCTNQLLFGGLGDPFGALITVS